MTYKGYIIEISDTNGYGATISIYTKTLSFVGRKARKLVTRFVVDTRINNPVDKAIEFIDEYTKGE